MKTSRRAFPCEHHSITNRQAYILDPSIILNEVIKSAYCSCILVLWIEHSSAPENVVGDDQTAGPQQPHASFVVLRVVHLVGVNESHIQLALKLGQTGDGYKRGSHSDLDLLAVRALRKISPRYCFRLRVHVTRYDPAAVGQALRHHQPA